MSAFDRLDGRFLFADTVRFWCTCAVVALHCSSILLSPGRASTVVHDVVSTVLKFGTVGFFLISGFLLGKGLRDKAPLALLRDRLRKVFVPWLTWFGIVVGVRSGCLLLAHQAPFAAGYGLEGVLAEAGYTLTNTSTWFVPNLLISLGVLLLLLRVMPGTGGGMVLLGLNLVYTANIYGNWFFTGHTRALFAFVFYLWLGQRMNMHLEWFKGWLARMPSWLLLAATGCAGAAAFLEVQLLRRLHSADPLNTLRLSNQVYSVLVVLCLCKVSRRCWPGFVSVSRDMFGIYLSHALVVGACLALIRRSGATATRGAGWLLLLWLVATLMSLGAGFLLTRVLAAGRFTAWLAGTQRAGRVDRLAPWVAGHKLGSGAMRLRSG